MGHILRPIVKTVLDCERIARIYPGLREHFIEPVYGSVEDLRKSILADFFREAFGTLRLISRIGRTLFTNDVVWNLRWKWSG